MSERAREIICDTDFNCMAICYGGMFTAKEFGNYTLMPDFKENETSNSSERSIQRSFSSSKKGEDSMANPGAKNNGT